MSAVISSSRMPSDDEEIDFWDEIKCYRAPTGVTSVRQRLGDRHQISCEWHN